MATQNNKGYNKKGEKRVNFVVESRMKRGLCTESVAVFLLKEK